MRAVAEALAEAPGAAMFAGASGVPAMVGSALAACAIPQDSQMAEPVCAAAVDAGMHAALDAVQGRWAAMPIAHRLQVIRGVRHALATRSQAVAEAISPALQRSQADTLVTELLPLLDAMRFLEHQATKVLATRRLGREGRPMWLAGVQAEIERVPLGQVLVIGPANFPLFLPGVQVMQALVAGNAVTWKPGVGGKGVADLVADALREAGLPRGVLRITEESVEAAQEALAQLPAKVIFTGSFESGRKILSTLAETATPAVMELSGADAVVVLPSAHLPLVAKAVAFGLRLNGGEVCMSPRRLVGTAETLQALRPLLLAAFEPVAPVQLKPQTAERLRELVRDAVAGGAEAIGTVNPEAQRPLLLDKAACSMRVVQSDVFAPVLSLLEARSVSAIPEMVNACPYRLTAAVFGTEGEARAVGARLRVGTVLINDLIAPTADPRVPFGGLGRSGFGATRGAEGLLEMTSAKTVLVRRKGQTRQYEATGAKEFSLFQGLIGMLHGGSWPQRWQAMRAVATAGRGR